MDSTYPPLSVGETGGVARVLGERSHDLLDFLITAVTIGRTVLGLV